MIREITTADREVFLQLLDEFYHSPAVLHPVPRTYFERTFQEVTSGSPYARAYLLECGGAPAGYAQLSFTYSTEAGGRLIWVEELYVRPQYQGRGLGGAFFRFLEETYAGQAARIRLEVEPDNDGARRLYGRVGFEELPYMQMCRDFPAE